MRRFNQLFLIFYLIVFTTNVFSQNNDYLLTVTNVNNGITSNNSTIWSDITSVTIDVTDMSKLFVSATINLRPEGSSAQSREVWYNIYQSDSVTHSSGILKRQISKNGEIGVESWGVGTLVHIFDVSNLTGNKTFIIEHKNHGYSANNRNVYSMARLSAISLTSKINGHELNNNVKRLSTYITTTSSTYVPITGLETDSMTLPAFGDFFITASINSKASASNTVAMYKLQYSMDGGATYADVGKPVKRSMYSKHDDGIVTIVAVLQDQKAGAGYKFRLVHSRESGTATVSTGNVNLVAIALSHNGGGYFPSFIQETGSAGVNNTGISSPPIVTASTTLRTGANIGIKKPDIFFASQCVATASGLNENTSPKQRMRVKTEMYVSVGGMDQIIGSSYRYLEDNDVIGMGGFLGLALDVNEHSLYTVGMKEGVSYISNPDTLEDETMNCSNIVLCGFQTIDKLRYLWEGNINGNWNDAANWANGIIPDSTCDVLIGSGLNSLNISGVSLRKCRKLTVMEGVTLGIESGASLVVYEQIINNGIINVVNNGSLIQTQEGLDNNSGSGIYNISRTGNASSFMYNIWSSPIRNAQISSVFPSTNPCDVWVFDPEAQGWSYDYLEGLSTVCYGNPVTFTQNNVIMGGDGVMDLGRGYFIPGQSPSSRIYSGIINNGDITQPIVTTNLGNPGGTGWADDDWNLVGNPYPSAINSMDFWNENAINNGSIENGLYFWDEGDTTGGYNQFSDYAVWNLSGGINSGNSSLIPNGHISSGQGFWVIAKSNSNLVFNNTMRSGSNDQFFKRNTCTKHNLRISIHSPSNYQNNILVGYNENSTDGIDADYDAYKLTGNLHVKFASMIGTDEFVIQSLGTIKLGDIKKVPLSVRTDEQGIHIFNLYQTENIPSNIVVSVLDKSTGTTGDITSEPFTVSLDPNVDYDTRFELVIESKIDINNNDSTSKDFGSNTTPTSINEEQLCKTKMIYQKDQITLLNKQGIEGFIQVFDAIGREVLKKHQNALTNSLSINVSNLTQGLYLIRVTKDSKITFQNKLVKL